jgi:hypothetical protein
MSTRPREIDFDAIGKVAASLAYPGGSMTASGTSEVLPFDHGSSGWGRQACDVVATLTAGAI